MSEQEEILEEYKNSIQDLSKDLGEAEFPIKFVKRNTILGKALASDTKRTIKLRKGDNKIELKEVAFLESVILDFASENIELNIEVKTLEGKWVKLKSSPPDSLQRKYIANLFVSEIKVNNPQILLSVKLNSIQLRGFDIKDLSNIERQYMEVIRKIDDFDIKAKSYIDDVRNDIEHLENLQESSEGLDEEILSKQNEVSSLVAETKNLKERKDELVTKNENLRDTISNKTQTVRDLDERESEKDNELKALNVEIQKNKAELKKLEDNKSLFSDELSSFFEQSNKVLFRYGVFVFLCIGIIGFLSYYLYSGAVNLANSSITWEQAFAGFLNKIPLTLINALLIASAYKIAMLFASRYMDLHSKKLEISKLMIVAREVTDSEIESLDISDDYKYQKRLEIKMGLISEYLKSEVPGYKPKKAKTDTYEEPTETEVDELDNQHEQ